MYFTDHNEILHTSRQSNCREVCKLSLWSVEHILNYSTPSFDRISNCPSMRYWHLIEGSKCVWKIHIYNYSPISHRPMNQNMTTLTTLSCGVTTSPLLLLLLVWCDDGGVLGPESGLLLQTVVSTEKTKRRHESFKNTQYQTYCCNPLCQLQSQDKYVKDLRMNEIKVNAADRCINCKIRQKHVGFNSFIEA